MLPIIENIEIDKDAIIPCPEVMFKGRRACKACPTCSSFEGIAIMCQASTIDIKDKVSGAVVGVRPIRWDEKYIIRCSFTMERRTQIVEVLEE